MAKKQKVIFVCTHNSARSQMAEGLLRHKAGDRFEVFSAGTESTRVRPQAIAAMDEVGIDIRAHTSDAIDRYMGQEFDYVITVCDHANETCPYFPTNRQRLHWSFPDPAAATGSPAEVLQAFRDVRDQINHQLDEFLSKVG